MFHIVHGGLKTFLLEKSSIADRRLCNAVEAHPETPKMSKCGGHKASIRALVCTSTVNPRLLPMNSFAKSLVALSAGTLLISSAAFAQQMSAGRADLMSSVPTSSLTVTDWYKQAVYDKSNTKIGDINDVLVGPKGEVNAVIIGVGGFLGAGEKDVAVNFNSIKKTTKDNKTYLTMDTTKDALKGAPGFKYDSDKTSWVPASK